MNPLDYQNQYSYRDLLLVAISKLRAISNNMPQLDSRLILTSATKKTFEDIIRNYDQIVDFETVNLFNNMLEERINGKPVAKITGYKEFWRQSYAVNEHVLDPRSETELIIDYISTVIHQHPNQNFNLLDLGTGSGCIAISLLAECLNLSAKAIDISNECLNLAQKNAELNKVSDRLCLEQNNWLDNINDKFDFIVTNPPYIKSQDIENLDIEVRKFDPLSALDGGMDGLGCYAYMAKQIDNVAHNNSVFICEIGLGQAKDITNLVEQNSHFRLHEKIKDYRNITRVLVFTLGKENTIC